MYERECLGSNVWALSRISPRVRVRVRVSDSIVLGLATAGYSWIWPLSVEGMSGFLCRITSVYVEQL